MAVYPKKKSWRVCYWYDKTPRCVFVEHGLAYITFYVQKPIEHLKALFWCPDGSRRAARGARINETALYISNSYGSAHARPRQWIGLTCPDPFDPGILTLFVIGRPWRHESLWCFCYRIHMRSFGSNTQNHEGDIRGSASVSYWPAHRAGLLCCNFFWSARKCL